MPEPNGSQGRVYTIGHSTRSTEVLVRAAKSAGVGRIIDVRRFPGSRRNPHLAREALERSLPPLGIHYEWWGETLGGRRSKSSSASRHTAWRNASFHDYADHMDTEEFRTAFATLEEEAQRDPPLAIMCAEILWWKCHRRLISDALTLHGFEVIHIVNADETQPHKPHPQMRADKDGYPLYDLGEKTLF